MPLAVLEHAIEIVAVRSSAVLRVVRPRVISRLVRPDVVWLVGPDVLRLVVRLVVRQLAEEEAPRRRRRLLRAPVAVIGGRPLQVGVHLRRARPIVGPGHAGQRTRIIRPESHRSCDFGHSSCDSGPLPAHAFARRFGHARSASRSTRPWTSSAVRSITKLP